MASKGALTEYTKLKVGDTAPDFSLRSGNGESVKLSEYQGKKNVVLLFYPMAFSGVCSIQLPGYQAAKPQFDAKDTELLGISTDNPYTAKEFAKQLGVEYQLLSDMQRKASEAYGVLREEGFTNRAAFVIDKQGVLRHIEVTSPGEQPDQQEVLRALEKIG